MQGMDSDNANGSTCDDGMELSFSEDEVSSQLLSPFTNKPYLESDNSDRIIFWCGTCSTKLINTYCVIQHMKSNKHKRSCGLPVDNDVPGRGLGNTKTVQPSQPQHDSKPVQGVKNLQDAGFETAKSTEPTQSEPPPDKDQKNPQILDLKCLICDVSYDTLEAMEEHVKEDGHLDKLSEMMKPPNPRCEVCDMDFNSTATRDIHFKGKKHLNRVKVVGEVQGSIAEKNGNSISKDVPLSCKFCKVSFNGVVVATLHFKSRKHDNQMQMLGYPSTFDASGKRKHEGGIITGNKKLDIDPLLENVSETQVMSQWQSGNIGITRPVGRGVQRARGRGRGRGARGRGRGPSNASANGSQDPQPLMSIPSFPANSNNQFPNNLETNALGKVKYRDVARGRPVFLPQNRHDRQSHQQALYTNHVNDIQHLQNQLEYLQSDMHDPNAYLTQY